MAETRADPTLRRVDGRAARVGRTQPVQDGMIAAIANVHGAAIATRNITDFEGLDIDLVDPWND